MRKKLAERLERRMYTRVAAWAAAAAVSLLVYWLAPNVPGIGWISAAVTIRFAWVAGWANGRKQGFIEVRNRWYCSVGREMQRVSVLRGQTWRWPPGRLPGTITLQEYESAIKRCVPPEWESNNVGAWAAIQYGRAYEMDHEGKIVVVTPWPLETLS